MSREVINGKYKIRWLPTQRKVLNALGSMDYSIILYCGGFGSGKSRLAGELALQLSMKYPGIEIGFWRKTRASIKDTTYRIFLEKVIPPEFIRKHNQSSLTIIDRNGSRYDFLGMDKITRKGSYWFDVIFLDEAIEFEEAEIRMMEGRLRSKHVPRPQLVAFTNAGAPGTFWHKEVVQKNGIDKSVAYFDAPSFENIHNPPQFFERISRWKGTQYYNRYVLVQWIAFAGNVWHTFDPKTHVVDPFEIPNAWRKIIAIDWGYENPMVILWMAKDPLHERWVVYRQFYHTRTLVRDAVKIARDTSAKAGEDIAAIWGDHDAEDRAQFEEDWKEVMPANKEVRMGIQTVQEYLFDCPDGKPGLLIFNDTWNDKEGYWYGLIEKDIELEEAKLPCCFQDEIPEYKWGKDETPVAENNHGCDGFRYGAHSEKHDGKTKGSVKIIEGHSFSRE